MLTTAHSPTTTPVSEAIPLAPNTTDATITTQSDNF
jgi:hypothetical protein